MIEQKIIDVEYGRQLTFSMDSKVFWYLINGRDEALALYEDTALGNQARNLYYTIPDMKWRSNSQSTSNAPGAEVIGDREIDATKQSFRGDVVATDYSGMSAKLDRYGAFLDKSAGHFSVKGGSYYIKLCVFCLSDDINFSLSLPLHHPFVYFADQICHADCFLKHVFADLRHRLRYRTECI